MIKRAFLLKFILINIYCCSAYTQNNNELKHIDSYFKDINGVSVHYEIYGKGEPLLLLHGNRGSSADFFMQIPELSKYFRVIAMDSRGQGKTSDSYLPITYEQMALDVSKMIDTLGYKQVNIIGWSDGANVGLELAKAFPEKIIKMVMFAGNYKIDSTVVTKAVLDTLQNDLRLAKSRTEKKLIKLLLNYPKLTSSDLQKIKVPILVMAGEHDLIKESHTRELHQYLLNSKLIFVKNANHIMPWEQPGVFNQYVLNYLLGDKPVRTISGVVVSLKNNEPLEYVNIGIAKKNFGTVSLKNGRFTINIPYKYQEDTLLFSLVGYVNTEKPLSNFTKERDTVYMPDKIINLQEVQVVAKMPKKKKIGIRSHSPIVTANGLFEFAYLIDPSKLPVKIDKINFYLLTRSDSCSFRISFYKDRNNMPEENVSTRSVIVKIKVLPGWNELDMKPFSIVMHEKFYIGIEGLPDLNTNKKPTIMYGAKLIRRGQTFTRKASLGAWERLVGNISINATLIEI